MTSDASCGVLCMLIPSVSPGYVRRLFKKSYLGVIHYSLLLMLFGAAAFKAVHTPLLTAMLVSELASVLCLAGKMQASHHPFYQMHICIHPEAFCGPHAPSLPVQVK